MKDSVLLQLGKQVKDLRKKNNLTQEELAIRSRISLKYIQKIEGKTPSDIGLETLEKLAKGFGLPLWQLVKFD
jgi:transcriptional regulator with XRE-family HTH domain